jgi:hypothetical protein
LYSTVLKRTFYFESGLFKIAAGNDSESCGGWAVGISQADKAMEYRRYAEHCLRTAATLPNQEDRIIHREMSAEWFMLADQAGRKDLSPGAQSNGQAKAGRGQLKRGASRDTV